MIPVKTLAGHQALKDRTVTLSLRQRAALIVIDGKRGLSEILQSAGVTREDIEKLFELGLVADTAITSAPTRPAPLGRL